MHATVGSDKAELHLLDVDLLYNKLYDNIRNKSIQLIQSCTTSPQEINNKGQIPLRYPGRRQASELEFGLRPASDLSALAAS